MIYLVSIICLIVLFIIIGFVYWSFPIAINEPSTLLTSDLKIVRDAMMNDSYLHRLLMIEIINTEENDPSIASDTITYNKMATGIGILGKALVRSFGSTISQRIMAIFHKRNEIIREYYRKLRTVVCEGLNCAFKTEPEISTFKNTDTLQENFTKLETLNQDIADNIAGSFQIKDSDANKKRPISHYQRLYNLLNMYDKELLNQAKSYAFKQYDISMNCAQGALEVSYHISDELNILMKDIHDNITSN